MPLSVDSVSPLNEHSSCAPSSFPVPPHLMGRNVHNPTNDPTCPGRRLQKPRLGVRIPYRNLTSQIVTQEEIAQEILQRAMKKSTSSQSPSAVAENILASGESVFAVRLSKHLANRLSSPNKDLEAICNRNTADIRAKVQAELNGSSVKQLEVPGPPGAINQSTKEIKRIPGVDASPATSTSPSYSSRLNHHVTKLDKDVEREMALKQLKELPNIKGRSGEFTGDSSMSRSTRRALNYSTSVSPPSSPNAKDVEKKKDTLLCHGDDCISQCVHGNLIVHLHKIEDFPSTQSQEQVVSNHTEPNSTSQPVQHPCAEKKIMGKVIQCKYAKTDKVFPKESKLRINKTFKSKLTNGHCSAKVREKIRKRRSARLNIAPPRNEALSLLSNGSLNPTKKKPGRKKKCIANLPLAADANSATVLERTCNESSHKEHASSQNACDSKLLSKVKIEQFSALKDATDTENYSLSEMKERKVSVIGKRALKNGLEEVSRSTCVDSKEPKKASPVQRFRELDKLLMDEGAINMILETSPLGEIIKPRRIKYSNKKLTRAMNQESINIRAKLVKKHVLCDIKSSSKPKLRLIKEKLKDEFEVIDLTHSPSKKISPSKVTAPISPNSTAVRRHSSSDSSSVCSISPMVDESSKSSIFDSKNLVQQNSVPKSETSENKIPFVNLECIKVAQVKTPLISNKQNNLFRLPSVRKAVTVPRMSNAVRMKLNTEMSKNFLRGLNVENAKFVPLKTLKTKRNCETPLKTTSMPDQVKAKVFLDNDGSEIESPKVSEKKSVSPKDVKSMEILHGKELSVCVTKLEEKNEVSFTSVHDGQKDRLCNGHVIPEALPAPSMVSKNMSPQLSIGTAKDISKVKKFRDPNVTSFKHLIDKEHRIVTVPLSPIAASYNRITKGLKSYSPKHKKKTSKLEKQVESRECLRQRFSGRQNAGTFSYKEICLRRYENFVQIILAPCSTVMKNSLNVQVLHEFQDALQQLRRDRFCKVVLVTSTGSTFCQGLDLHSLIHVNIEHRKKAAEQLSRALKDFLKTLAMFNKPIVAGVHGASVGLGVTMLPFFDVVYASDKATFHTPYARLGQVPEGAAVLTLPLLLGNAVTSELLFGSRRLTASEAVHHGLVTRVLWPDKFQEELIPNVEAIANQSSQAMESMKALLRLNLRVKLDATLDSESSLLVQHWCSPECQRNFRKFLETSDDVLFQRQKKEPS